MPSNRVESTEAAVAWHNQRGNTSENCIKELKIGFGMERMLCGQFAASAAFFRIDMLAHNLFVLFALTTLDRSWHRYQVATVRWCLLQIPGKVVHHAIAYVLIDCGSVSGLIQRIREQSAELARNSAVLAAA